jgi:hypothetical protein
MTKQEIIEALRRHDEYDFYEEAASLITSQSKRIEELEKAAQVVIDNQGTRYSDSVNALRRVLDTALKQSETGEVPRTD